MHSTQPIIAIIGAGAIGLATAADLGRRGYRDLRLCDSATERSAPLARTHSVCYAGLWGEGETSIALATTDHAAAVSGADVVLVSTTADVQAQVAHDLAPSLSDGQIVLLHQGYTGGGLLFARALHQHGCRAQVIIAETINALYLCAVQSPGAVFIRGLKAWLEVTAYPARQTQTALRVLGDLFPQFAAGSNSLATGLNNPNPIVHPAAYLLNQGLRYATDEPIGQGLLHFDELMTAPIQEIADRVDQERMALLDALGLASISRGEFSRRCYPDGAVLRTDLPRFGPKLLPRFIYEDVPTGLVPIASLAAQAGVATPVTRLLIDLASLIAHRDFWESGRTIERFGLAGRKLTDIVHAFG